MLHRAHRHKKTGNTYVVMDLPKLKLNNEWVEAVLYREYNLFTFNVSPDPYVRTLEDFLNKFEEIDFSSAKEGA